MVSFVLLHAEVKSLATREESIVSYHTLRSTKRPLVHLKNKHVIQQHISEQIGPKGLQEGRHSREPKPSVVTAWHGRVSREIDSTIKLCAFNNRSVKGIMLLRSLTQDFHNLQITFFSSSTIWCFKWTLIFVWQTCMSSICMHNGDWYISINMTKHHSCSILKFLLK